LIEDVSDVVGTIGCFLLISLLITDPGISIQTAADRDVSIILVNFGQSGPSRIFEVLTVIAGRHVRRVTWRLILLDWSERGLALPDSLNQVALTVATEKEHTVVGSTNTTLLPSKRTFWLLHAVTHTHLSSFNNVGQV